MKKILFLISTLLFPLLLAAQNEIGPDGEKLLIFILLVLASLIVFVILARKNKQPTTGNNYFGSFFKKKLEVKIVKDALYYPDVLRLTITNTRNNDVDLDHPLLIFDNFWLKRKFKIKGMGNRTLYPLYLEKGKSHTLEIDLNRFYFHDKSLKKYPKAKVIVSDTKGRTLGSKSVFLRKTLFKY